MLNVSVDIAGLTQAQRESLTAFILNFPPDSQYEESVPIVPFAPVAEEQEEPQPELDAAGKPWDAAVHASSKAKTSDGLWRKRRAGQDAPAPVAAPPAPAPVAAPPVPAPVAAPPVPADRAAFVSLIGMASAAIREGKLTQDELTASVASAGVASLPLLATHLDLVPVVREMVEALIASRS